MRLQFARSLVLKLVSMLDFSFLVSVALFFPEKHNKAAPQWGGEIKWTRILTANKGVVVNLPELAQREQMLSKMNDPSQGAVIPL
jgi:hypothetical protein